MRGRHLLTRCLLTGLLILVPTWGTFLILQALFRTIDGLLEQLIGSIGHFPVPGLGVAVLIGLILLAGAVATHVVGARLVRWTHERLSTIPLVSSIFLTIKGMTDLFDFKSRFTQSTVVAFPFPRDGLWALGFVMGVAPPRIQVDPLTTLLMVFVPTAIHPFTGYLAFVPKERVVPVNLAPEEAIKLEFSAGLYRPKAGWLAPPPQR